MVIGKGENINFKKGGSNMETKCPTCGVEGYFSLLCDDCIKDLEEAKKLQTQIKEAKTTLYDLQNKHLKLTGRQYFG